MKTTELLLVLCAALLLWPPQGRAEVSEIRITRGFGIAFLPLMIMENAKLIEKHAKAAGLGETTVSWPVLGSVNAVNDALLSGNLDFAAGGPPSLITLWARTGGAIRGVCAMTSIPMYLNTRNQAVKSVKDFSDKDRIALPGVKVSIQALVLQMAAAQAFGEANYTKLDPLTVTLSHPDGVAALSSELSEINSHFTVPPFQLLELKNPAVHTVLTSYDVLGGPATLNMVWTTARFREANPKTYRAFLAAFKEAIDTIQRDRKAAAEFYLRVSKDKMSVDDILGMLNDPRIVYTMVPQNTMKYAEFMHRIGTIKVKPSNWAEMFFPEAHQSSGS
jgi:NitT/TauT family transport system substrate-binding protein